MEYEIKKLTLFILFGTIIISILGVGLDFALNDLKEKARIESLKPIPELEIVLSTNDTVRGKFVEGGIFNKYYLSVPDSVEYPKNQIVSIKKNQIIMENFKIIWKTVVVMIIIAIAIYIIIYTNNNSKNRKLREVVKVLSFIKDKRELEEIIKKELRKIGESPTDKNIISFLENNEELLSEEYEKINDDKKAEFKNVIEHLIHSKKRDLL